MKRFLAVLASLVLLVGASFAEDYASMGDDELLLSLNKIRNELLTRNLNDEMILSSYAGVLTVYLDGFAETWNGGLRIRYIAVNTGDVDSKVSFDSVKINGWKISLFDGVSLKPGEKIKDEIVIFEYRNKTDLKSIDEIEDIVMYSHGKNQDSGDLVREIILK